MSKTRIVLADDHKLVREGIAHLLESFGEIEIVGQASDGQEAIKIVKNTQPDIAILDISMPKLRGIEAISEIKNVAPSTLIIILSMFSKEKYIKDSLRNGASAYLLKESAAQELYDAVYYVKKGQIYLSPAISKNIVQGWLRDSSSSDNIGQNILTTREGEILKLLAEGYSNKEIAGMLFISPKTVETHRHRINEKLELGNIADLVRYAIKEGFISID